MINIFNTSKTFYNKKTPQIDLNIDIKFGSLVKNVTFKNF